ncbi:hypothetical protein J3R83DRAFT_5546 [Lanmaoa asiatica]|nr:hypothetical protein J3R83DRAFT_5546 [Lanmaoa asiatica]
MLSTLSNRGVHSSGPQYLLSHCQFTNVPPTETTQTRFSPLQSPSPSRIFKSPTQQPALPLGIPPGAAGSERAICPPVHYSLSAIHVEEPASSKANSTQAKIARIFPINSESTPITPYSMSASS